VYVECDPRSQGIDRQVLQWLIENAFPTGIKMMIDGLANNPWGQAFWKRMGFEPYYTNMQLEIRR
jgi:GNAT superfamily N-acetyltransferase